MTLRPAIAPLWRNVQVDGNRASAAVVASVDLPVFDAHFPDNPLLPGIVQLLWAQALVEGCWPDLTAATCRGHSQVKFLEPVLPGDELVLALTRTDDRVAFAFEADGSACTRGILRYAG